MSLKSFDAATRKRLWVGLLLVMGLILLLSAMRYLKPDQQSNLPKLALMTTLPLQWSEGGIEAAISSDAKPHPVYARLSKTYDITPIDDLNLLGSSGAALMLMAQPRAFSPQELVKLDTWVRQGGKLLILADPALQWGSLYPIGDKRRPLFTSLLSPLFAHWGVELVLPIAEEAPVVLREVDAVTVRTQTPGEWQVKLGSKGGSCLIADGRLVADCNIGRGRALLVADADLLDAVYWQGQGVRVLTGSDEFANMQWIEALLVTLRESHKYPRDFLGK